METEPAVRVLVVDDQRPFRIAARAVLRRAGGFDVVGEAETGEQAVEMALELQPDLVLMDVRLPGISGVRATERIVGLLPRTTVFLCSTYQRSDLASELTTSGAAAYITKEELRPELLQRLWRDGAAPSLRS